MIQEITFTGKLLERLPFSKGPFTFGPGLNLIVGPNGSGKSTLLEAIHENTRSLESRSQLFKESSLVRSGTNPVLCWTSEEDGIRKRSYFSDDFEMSQQVMSMYISRGQAQVTYLFHWIKKNSASIRQGAVVLLDEPDVTLDMDGVAMLLKIFQHHTKSQFIVTAHHPTLILQKADTLLELSPGYVAKTKQQMRDLLAACGEE